MEVLKLGVVFFILFMIFSTLISHYKAVFAGDFAQIYEEVWAEGKWIQDVGMKAVISFVYALYMVNRRMPANTHLHH